jgi:hypothetical protein
MTTAYDTKLTQILFYLRSQSGWKGLFQVHLRRQVRLDRRSRAENKNTLLVDILFTHIMCTECQRQKHSKIHTQNPYQVPSFYRNMLTAVTFKVTLMTVHYGRK